MPSLRNFGSVPERQQSWRRFEVDDDEGSGAYRRPRSAGFEQGLEDDVILPLERPRLGGPALLATLALAFLAVLIGLYLGGFVGRPKLNPSEPPAPLIPNSVQFDQWVDSQALERARLLNDELSAATAVPAPAAMAPAADESEIQVVDETPSPPKMRPASRVESEPRVEPEPREAPPTSRPLDDVGGVAPPVLREPELPPMKGEAAPENEPLPEPAKPTAPAETIPPEGSNPD